MEIDHEASCYESLPATRREVAPKIVEECFTHEGEILELVVNGKLMNATSEHPFYERKKRLDARQRARRR